MSVPIKKYNIFIQRFTEQFHKEIDCPDNEATLQTLITLMNKCGLRELLDQSTVTVNSTMVHRSSPHQSPHNLTSMIQCNTPATIMQFQGGQTSSTLIDTCTNNSTGKRSNGFILWQRERKMHWINEGRQGSSPNYHGEWKMVPESVKEEYRAQARAMRS